ncbi:transcription termination factor 3, mitochondrial [Tachysurus vachellii]|uniref:transcription termination factor 3, mitochondrial n=1 Tax=Tachysurus vachellii TaxID=175792 RepID=UPI00296A922E|nr:transcription termination factor 3, mitochondrial [Tachysurus vachellii]
MNLCGRCVMYLQSRMLCIKPQHVIHVVKLPKNTTCIQTALLLHPHSRLQRWKDKWTDSYGIRFFSDQRTDTPPCHTDSRITEQHNPQHGLVPVINSELHQCSSAPGPVPAEHTSIDLDALSCPSAFEEISDEDAIQIIVPPNLPDTTFTLRDYVDKSETLTNLVHLGVNLSKLEERPNVGSMLVRLNFQDDVVPRLLFLKDLGVQDVHLGPMLTKNPFLLTENMENLQNRVSYLKSKKFSSESVAEMVSKAPYLLNFSVKRLDNRLGFFQKQLGLSAHKTRDVVTRLPRLLCGSLEPVKENLKVCELEFGFRRNEIQHIVTVVPKVLTANKRKLTQIFDFVHNIMGVPHSLITKFPQVLNAKFLRVRERHFFLEYLGRAHYEPTHPNYISLERLVALPDEAFCSEVALASLDDFERFQKTL